MNRSMKRKAAKTRRNALLVVALMLVVCIASIGGTIAWLTDSTGEVKNTFTPSDIDITLTETPNQQNQTWSAHLVPGKDYAKDPVVAVVKPKTDVDVYLFVKFEETNNTDLGGDKGKILLFTSNLNTDNGWTQGTGTDGNGVPTNVWFRTVPANAAENSWKLLAGKGEGEFKNGFVTVNPNLTKEDMPAAGSTPELKYTAYAIQTHGMANVGDAWSKVGN